MSVAKLDGNNTYSLNHDVVVLLPGYGSRRLPAEKFLHLVSVVAAERRELTSPARQ